jgi:glycosyltransferase involved in cell wall biosynthesis
VTSVAMLSRAVGPPWADGSINTHVAWARALPDVDFRWFASAAWRPTEPNFRATRLGTSDNSWGPTQKVRFAAWLATTRADLSHLVFYPQPATLRMLRPLLATRRRPVVQTIQAAFAPSTPIPPLLVTRHVVAVSARIARELTAAVPELDVTVVHPAVDLALVGGAARSDAVSARVRDGLGVAGDRRFVLYAGNWSEPLGVLEALEVFALVADEVSDVDLVVANRASLRSAHAAAEAAVRDRFATRAESLGLGQRVRIFGLVPEFRAVIAAAAAVLFPALDLREGKLDLPLVLLEAVALGVPVAVYDIAPLDEFAFGPAGAVADPGDRTALATRLATLLADPTAHRDAAAAGRALASEAFDPAARAGLLRGVYERALGG